MDGVCRDARWRWLQVMDGVTMKPQLAALLCATLFGCSGKVDSPDVADSQATLDVALDGTVDATPPDDRFADGDASDSTPVDTASSDDRDVEVEVPAPDIAPDRMDGAGDIAVDDRRDAVSDSTPGVRPPAPSDCCSVGVELGGCWTIGGSLVGGACQRLCDGPPRSFEIYCWDSRGCPMLDLGIDRCKFFK